MLCKFSGAHAYDCLVLGCLLLFICNALDLEVRCLDSSMQRPSIHPYAYRTRIILLPLLLLLLLFHCCCCFAVAATKLLLLINFCEQELFSGAAELTTQLLRLTSIFWFQLSQINKLGNTTREDCCDPLYLWVIMALAEFPPPI